MKKIKLLMPILGVTGLVAAATTVVSCNNKQEKVNVTVENDEAETESIIPTISSETAVVGKDFKATITWDAATTGAYYINNAVVIVGDNVIAEYNETSNPNGFHFSNHTANSVVITLPKANIVAKTDISINVYIKHVNFDATITIDEYEDEYIVLRRGGSQKIIATYDALRSKGSYPADKDNPDEFIKVAANSVVEFAFDLTKWTGPFNKNGSLYALMGFWNPSSDEFEQLYPITSQCDYVWYGDTNPTPIDCVWTQTTAAFEFKRPAGGWGEHKEDRKTLFFRYKFESKHDSYFQIVLGQEHMD